MSRMVCAQIIISCHPHAKECELFQDFHFYFFLFSEMKFKALLLLSSFSIAVLLLNSVNCENDEQTRQGRILNNRKNYDTAIEQQLIQEYPTQNATDATADELIDEIIDSSRQGRNVEGLEAIYDLNINEALNNGNEVEARNLIRDKLCDLGLMQCDELIPKRPQYPTRVIYTQPPPGAQIYSNRPMSNQQQPQYNNVRPPIQSIPQKSGQIYGPAKPMPLPPISQNQPPRKIGFASELNSYESSSNKFNNYYESDPNPSSIKFGYTEKPTIVVNQGKREANGLVQNHHVHHHYVHVDGNSNGGLVDGSKTVLVNTPISEYSAVDNLSSSYQTSGFGTSGASSNLNGFSPMSSNNNYEYKGVNSGQSSYQGLHQSSGNYQGVKPVYEGNNQYATGTNYNKYTQVAGPAIYTEGSNGVYNPSSSQQHAVQGSFHTAAPEFHKKELNLNGYRGNGLTGSGYASQQQQPPNPFYNSQKVQQQQNSLYSKNPYEQNQGQDQSDCVCVPFDQCPAQDIVGRRDDLILPLDPRNLPTEIEAAESDSNSTTVKSANVTTIETKKISKRAVDDVQKVQGEGVSTFLHLYSYIIENLTTV